MCSIASRLFYINLVGPARFRLTFKTYKRMDLIREMDKSNNTVSYSLRVSRTGLTPERG